jgi:hypothetical protein
MTALEAELVNGVNEIVLDACAPSTRRVFFTKKLSNLRPCRKEKNLPVLHRGRVIFFYSILLI